MLMVGIVRHGGTQGPSQRGIGSRAHFLASDGHWAHSRSISAMNRSSCRTVAMQKDMGRDITRAGGGIGSIGGMPRSNGTAFMVSRSMGIRHSVVHTHALRFYP